MHEDAIAATGEEEGNGLVHAVALRALWVGDVEMEFLPYFIEFGERFSAAYDMFARSETEDRIHGTGIVAATLDEREWQEFDLCGIIVDDMTRLCQDFSVLVAKEDAERIALNL
jgi:hypothetical protein